MSLIESTRMEDQNETQVQACLSVVIPVYNEGATLPQVVRKVLVVPHLLEVFIVDDGSTDGTSGMADTLAAEDERVQVVHHMRNQGKTAALRSGFSLTKGDVVIVQD